MLNLLQRLQGQWTRWHFEQQIIQLLPELYRTARSLEHELADAEDLVHDTCVKALAACKNANLADVSASRAWLQRILVNTYRDQYRRALRAPVRSAYKSSQQNKTSIVELAASCDPGPAEQTEHQNLAAATETVIAALPPEVRLVVTLFFINNLSYKEIATVADCPLGTVMSRLSRGRQIMRQRLRPYIDTDIGANVTMMTDSVSTEKL